MPRQTLGPWGKLYASLTADTAHYTDRQFRAFVGVLCLAIKDRGELPKIAPLRAIYGSDEIDFLIAEGRLVTSHNAVTVEGWTTYQAPIDRTNATRQRRWRVTHGPNGNGEEQVRSAGVDNALLTVHNGVTVTDSATSTSISKNEENDERRTELPTADFDALDRYHELTGNYPWGRRPGEWITELQTAHGVPNVIAALEVEYRDDKSMKTLLGRVSARLERQAYRVEQAAKKERGRPKLTPDQEAFRAVLVAQEQAEAPEPEVTPESIEAGRQAWAALKNGLSNGSTPVLASGQGRAARLPRSSAAEDR